MHYYVANKFMVLCMQEALWHNCFDMDTNYLLGEYFGSDYYVSVTSFIIKCKIQIIID